MKRVAETVMLMRLGFALACLKACGIHRSIRSVFITRLNLLFVSYL
jgi:hypothetical protein